MRSATVVLPVPGAPVKHMCRLGRAASRPNPAGSRSTRSSSRDVLGPPLDGHQADQVVVECAEHFVDAGGLALLGERDQGFRGKPARRRSGWPFQAVGARRRANDPGAGWAAGRRMGVLDIPRRPKAGIMGTISSVQAWIHQIGIPVRFRTETA